jgi:NDP-hexose-3-ketoreductase
LVENFMFPAHRQHAAVRTLLADGIIGTVRAFAATFAIPARPPGDIRLRADLGGGALLDVAGYPLRAALLFIGGDLAVHGAFLRTDRAVGVDIGGSALLVGAGEVTAALTFGLCHEYTSCYEFVGSAGRLTVDHVFTPPGSHHPVVRLVRRNEHEQRTLAADDQFLNSINAFTAAVRRGEGVDVETVVRQAELIDDVRSAADRTSPELGG